MGPHLGGAAASGRGLHGLASRFLVVVAASPQDYESGRKSWGFTLRDEVRMGPSPTRAPGASPAGPHLSPAGAHSGAARARGSLRGPGETLSTSRPLCWSLAQVTFIIIIITVALTAAC